jgi:hypothetical protein
MNKYVLTLAAAALIASAPAYYAFQAQADEGTPAAEADASAAAEASADSAAPSTTDEATPEAAEPASGETPAAPAEAGANE